MLYIPCVEFQFCIHYVQLQDSGKGRWMPPPQMKPWWWKKSVPQWHHVIEDDVTANVIHDLQWLSHAMVGIFLVITQGFCWKCQVNGVRLARHEIHIHHSDSACIGSPWTNDSKARLCCASINVLWWLHVYFCPTEQQREFEQHRMKHTTVWPTLTTG